MKSDSTYSYDNPPTSITFHELEGAAAMAIFITAIDLFVRYCYAAGDLSDFLPMAMQRVSPELFHNDWFLNARGVQIPRLVYVLSLSSVARIVGFPSAVFLSAFVPSFLGRLGAFVLARRLGAQPLVALAALFSYATFCFFGAGYTGYQAAGLPKGIALCFIVWGFVALVEARLLLATLLVCAAIQFHVQFGMFAAGVLGFALLFSRASSLSLFSYGSLLVAAILPWVVLASPVLNTTTAFGHSKEEFGYLLLNTINPSQFALSGHLAFAISLVTAIIVLGHAKRHFSGMARNWLLAVVTVALGGMGVGIVLELTHWIPLILLGPWRATMFICLTLAITGAMAVSPRDSIRLADWIPFFLMLTFFSSTASKGWFGLVGLSGQVLIGLRIVFPEKFVADRWRRGWIGAMLFLLVLRTLPWFFAWGSVLAEGRPQAVIAHAFHAILPLSELCADLAFFALLVHFYERARSFRALSATAVMTLVIVLGWNLTIERLYLANPKNRFLALYVRDRVAFGPTPTRPEEWVALWIQKHTPRDAVILAPPGVLRIKTISRRATVFQANNLPHMDLALLDRFTETAVDFMGCRSVFDAPRQVNLISLLYEAYPLFNDGKLEFLANKYGADYAIVNKDQLRSLPSLYDFDEWRVVQIPKRQGGQQLQDSNLGRG
jgi:hypothetical protein